MKYKKWVWLLMPALFLLPFAALAQVDPALESLRNLVPPSPTASSLGRYSEWPVSLYTGIPNISIPIYELKGRSIKLPIDISYHASGNRVGDIASWVGLGWSLNAGGVITRSVRGLPDEDSYFTYAANYSRPNSFNSSVTVAGWDQKHQADAANQVGDSQQDLYTFSAMGKSYRLLIRADHSVTTMPASNLKVTYSSPNSWTVVMEDGTSILFGGGSNFVENNTVTYGMAAGGITFPTAWYIQTITSPVGETISFTYSSKTITQDTHFTQSDWIQYITSSDYGGCTFVTEGALATHTQIQNVTALSLTKIETDLTKILFIHSASARSDLQGDTALSAIKVYSKLNNALVANYQFNTGYSLASASNEYLNTNENDSSYFHRRLRLLSLQKFASDGSSSQLWSFQYNAQNLPSRRSYAQDHSGFYNGATGNTTLLPPEYFVLPSGSGFYPNSWQYSYGFMPTSNVSHPLGANRGFSGTAMQAEILTQITYPTGGYTQFNYEPNMYPSSAEKFTNYYTATSALTVNSNQTATTQSTTFTITKPQYVQLQMNSTISASIQSDYSNPAAQAYAELKDPNGTIIGQLTGSGSVYNGSAYFNLIVAGTYTLVTTTNTSGTSYTHLNTDYLTVNATIFYSKSLGTQNFNQMVGGLRVKSILNYDGVSSIPINDRYFTYSRPFVINPVDSVGDYLTSQINTTSSYVANPVSGTGNWIDCWYTKVSRNSSTKYSLGSIQGGVIGYGNVTTSYGPTGANGTTVSVFNSAPDLNSAQAKLFPYPPSDGREWERGLLFTQTDYNASLIPVKCTRNTYTFLPVTATADTNFAAGFSTITTSHLCQNVYNFCGVSAIFFSLSSEQVLHTSSTETTYNTLGTDSVSTTTSYVYEDAANMQPTKSTMTNSKGDVIINYNRTALEASTINTSIPLSANATTALTTMVANNMVGLPVESERYVNGNVTDKLLINYQTFGTNVLPQEVKSQTASNAIQSRMTINNYDTHGNLLEQQKTGGPLEDYIYDYATNYVVASVSGGTQTDIAYTSFESTGYGNWTMSNTTIDSVTVAFTGTKSFSLGNGSISKTGLTTTKKYIVSYWTKSASRDSVLGTIPGSVIIGPTLNGWTYYEHKVTGVSAITVSGTGNIDELRLYPQGALMTTYTYSPIVGLTTTTNAKNEPTYYQYDGMLRLVNILDQNGNILKNYCYNYAGQPSGCPVTLTNNTQSSAAVSQGSFVSSDLMDNEWKQEAPPGYTVAADNGTVINAAGNAGVNAGRFAYFSTAGTLATPITYINGNLTFTAKGSGTIEIQLIATYNTSIIARQTFVLTSNYQTFTWPLTYLYPQLECAVGVIVNGGNSSTQASVQFQRNFSLNLTQLGLTGTYTRFRADSTSLIGNSEHAWYGWNDSYNTPRKKYLQHSAYSRMRFQTTARQISIEYVRDLYDKQVVNLFAIYQTQNNVAFSGTGSIISGNTAINNYTKVTAGQTYTISGFMTTNPTYVWYNGTTPLGAPQILSNSGTAQAPVYQVVAPANATNLGMVIQNTNDNYLVYGYGMIQQGAIGAATQYNGTIPSPWIAFTGYAPSYISGPAIFINGALYKYYQVQGTDVAKVIQFVSDTLPAGNKTVEVMMPGQGTYLPADPHIRRTGTYLRAVYFPGDASTTTVFPANTIAAGSIVYVHDSILSGFNISSDEENNVWMMMTKRIPSYGFTGDIFSEGYSGRLLLTDVSTPALTTAFAQKLASFGVDKYWFQLGVNDYSFTTSLPVFYAQYKSLIQQLKALRPNAKIYLQAVGPEFYEGANGETYADDGLTGTGPASNDYRDVQRAIATSLSYCEYVNFESLFSPVIANLSDGLHPTDVGNVLYANGLQSKSTLLGTIQPTVALAFYRNTTRNLIQTLPSIYTITATGGKAPYVFTLTSGTLPVGLTFNSDGTITGTPTANGTVSLGVKVTDANASTATNTYSLTVNPVPTVVVSKTAFYAIVNTATTVTYAGAQGYGLYTLSLTSGTVPTGMTFNATTGVLSGTPTTLGTYTYTIKAVDHWGFTGSTTFSFQVLSTPPTDNLTLTATVNSSNHLIVTGTLASSCAQNIFAYTAASYTQNSVTTSLAGNNVVIAANSTTGTVDLGAMALVPGNFSVTLTNQNLTPSSVNGVTITTPATTNVNLTATATSPSEAFTVVATIVSGHLMLTASLPNAPSTNINGTVGATVYQGSNHIFISGPPVGIPMNTTTSGPVDFGSLPTFLVSGSYTVQVYSGNLVPTIVDGMFITNTQYTYFYFTK